MLAGTPDPNTPLPDSVRRVAGGRDVLPVWRNRVGGITFAIGADVAVQYVKWAPAGSGLTLHAEAARLAWAAEYVTVPRVVALGSDETGEWLITRGIAGSNAVAPRWLAEPETAVRAVGAGLRRLHDRLPVVGCPFSWSAADRVADAVSRSAELDPADRNPEHRSLTVAEALRRIATPPAPDRLVVCHGDACAPNTLLADDGRVSGHVDLGALGVADRWADLAAATWSTEWNYGPGWTSALLDAYGVEPDAERMAYYRLLWDLDP